MSEPRLPDIHIVEVKDGYAGPITSPICDFCGDIGPKWLYDCAEFWIDWIPSPWGGPCWASTGEWCACEVCARLIDNKNLPELSARQIKIGIPVDYSGPILQGFFDHMTGEKNPFG